MLLFLSGSLCVLPTCVTKGAVGEHGGPGRGLLQPGDFFAASTSYSVLAPIALCYLPGGYPAGSIATTVLFLALLAAGATLSILAGLLFSRVYFQFIWRDFFASLGWAYSLLGVVFVLGLLASLIFGRKLEGAVRKLRDARSLWVPALWLILCGAFVFLYFIRQQGADAVVGYGFIKEMRGPSYTNESLVRWGWYLSFAGLAAVSRVCGMVLRGGADTASTRWALSAWLTPCSMPGTSGYAMHILSCAGSCPVVFPNGGAGGSLLSRASSTASGQ